MELVLLSLTFKKHRSKRGKARYGGLNVSSFHGFDFGAKPGYAKNGRRKKRKKLKR